MAKYGIASTGKVGKIPLGFFFSSMILINLFVCVILKKVENTKKLFRSQEAQQQLVEAESSSSQGVKNTKIKPSKTA